MNNRKDIDTKYKWNLNKIYQSIDELKEDIKKVTILSQQITEYKGKLMKSATNLYKATDMYFNCIRLLDKLSVYSNMKFHEDMSISKNKELASKIDKLSTKVNEELSFYTPELLKNDYSLIEKFVSEKEELKKYGFTFEELFREKKHILSLKEEKLLAGLGEVLTSSSDIFDMLDDVDISFENIHNENGEEVQLNSSNYSNFLKNQNRQVRKEAFTTFYKSYDKLKNTYAATLKANVESDNFIAKTRKYKSCLEMELYQDNIDPKLYDKLLKTVNDNLDIVYDYMNLKKEILNVDELHMYDIYAPLVNNNNNNKYAYEDAINIVLEALKPLGEKYINDLKKIINSNCIDVYNNKNKRGGAYSWGSYDTLPYVLLNFEGGFYDVSTIAHELGHSMHSYYSHQNQEYHNSSYTIFLAEIASTVNEILLNKYMYKISDTKEEKMFYLNNLLEDFRTTLIRQTMFAEFEKIIHEKVSNGEVLTEEKLSNTYLELNKKYYGKNIVGDEEIRLEWARISHFYNSFYVYKYATGISIACRIVSDILENKENALENYLTFLSSGGKDYSLNILKKVGIDIVNDDTIDKALLMFKDILNEFKRMRKC